MAGLAVRFAVTHGTRERAGMVRPTYVKLALESLDALSAGEQP